MRRTCPECNYNWAWKLGDGRFKCRRCAKRYCLRSAWEAVELSERVKRRLLDYFVLGVPAYRLRFRRLANRSTIEKFFRVVRAVMSLAENCTEPFCVEIECDETMLGGHRGGRGWGVEGKFIVLGILQSDDKFRAFPITGRNREVLQDLIVKHTLPGNLYHTNERQAYAGLAVRGGQVVVRKGKGKSCGRDHLNGIEGFWSYAKNQLYQYRGVAEKFFHIYLGEISFRYNHRKEDLLPLILRLMKHTPLDKINLILVRNR